MAAGRIGARALCVNSGLRRRGSGAIGVGRRSGVRGPHRRSRLGRPDTRTVDSSRCRRGG